MVVRISTTGLTAASEWLAEGHRGRPLTARQSYNHQQIFFYYLIQGLVSFSFGHMEQTMSKSARLRSEDVRGIIRLVGECRELGDDHAAWSGHLVQSVAALIRATWGETGECITGQNGPPMTLWSASWGWANGFERKWYDEAYTNFVTKGLTWCPMVEPYLRLLVVDNGICLTRNDLVSDADWRRSSFYQDCLKPFGAGPLLYCYRTTRANLDTLRIFNFVRGADDRDFSPRDRTIMRELHAAIAPLVGEALAAFSDPSPAALTSRTRQVLLCLLEGDGDKQIARRLGITPHTVNQYVKQIHRHFRVTSRSELLARWIRRGYGTRFLWADRDGTGSSG